MDEAFFLKPLRLLAELWGGLERLKVHTILEVNRVGKRFVVVFGGPTDEIFGAVQEGIFWEDVEVWIEATVHKIGFCF